jgi:hypothetical protein
MIILAISCVMLIGLMGCSESKVTNVKMGETQAVHVTNVKLGEPQAVHERAFNETKALDQVLKDHPEFPKAGEVKKIEQSVGGDSNDNKISGELKTTVQQSDSEHETYIVTLAKVWNVKVNGKEPKSIWKYKVTADKVELIKSEENDKLPIFK